MMEILLSSALLILTLALLRRLLRGKIDPRLQYALWLLVALRLLIPGTLFTVPISVSGTATHLWQNVSQTFQEEISRTEDEPSADIPTDGSTSDVRPQEDSSSTVLPEDSSTTSPVSQGNTSSSVQHTESNTPEVLPKAENSSTAAPAEDDPTVVQRLASLLSPLYDRYTETAEYPLGTSQEQWNQDITDKGYHINGYEVDLEGNRQIVTYSKYASIWEMPFWRWPWYTGIAVMGCALLGANLRFACMLRKKRQRISPEELPEPCRVPVYLVEDLPSPCLFGLFRPAIYINEQALVPGRLSHILAHEQTHLRHGDHLWSLLRAVCLTLYWFDPLVWWAAILNRRDSELACDHSAIRHLGEDQRLDYGKTLVDMIVPGRSLSGLFRTATTMTDKKRTMKERILLIAKKPQMAIATLVLVLVGAAAAVLLAFGGTQENAEDSSDSLISRLSFTAPESDGFLNRREGVYTFLIAGLEDTEVCTDTLFLATYDVAAGEVNFLSIPRDTAVDVSWEFKRINTVYNMPLSEGGGIENLKQQVRSLTGVFPDYYFVADTGAVGQLVDALGGVWFDVPFTLDYDDPYQDLHIHQEAGYRLLTGEDAMEIVRWRRNNGSGGSDITDRIPLQQAFFQALAQRCLELEDWSDVLELAGIFSENVTTDLPASSLLWFAQQAMEIDSDQVQFFTLPCDEGYAQSPLYLLADPEETADLVNQYFNPYTYDISPYDLCRMIVTEDGQLMRDPTGYAQITHSKGLFSFYLSLTEEDLAAVNWTEDAMGVTFYRDGEEDWFLRICPQPEEWLESHPSDNRILLESFDTNGTPHCYVMEWQGDFTTEAQRQAAANSFRLTLDASLISQLVHDSYESDMATAITYLPYLSWQNYQETCREDDPSSDALFDLLSALSSYAASGKATWGQYHDILSAPLDEAIDGAYATAYQDILWALYRSAPDTFASVVGSSYISETERDNAVYWLRAPLAEEQGQSESSLSDEEVRVILGLSDGSTDEEDLPTMPGEMINGFMRGWAPIVTSLGDEYPVETSVSGDWSLASITQAIQAGLEQSLAGTKWADQLTDVTISYAFSPSENPQSGDVLEIPYYAMFSTVYTVEGYAPEEFSLSCGPFTARVTLTGDGSLTASQDFLDRQTIYRQLEGCTQGIALEAVSGSSFDLSSAIQEAIEAKLEAAGLAADYRITALSLGSYTIPSSLSPGTVQTITGTVCFSPTGESGIATPDISFTATCTTVEE